MSVRIPSFAIPLGPDELLAEPSSCYDREVTDLVERVFARKTAWEFTFRNEWQHGMLAGILEEARFRALQFLFSEVSIVAGADLERAYATLQDTVQSLATNERYLDEVVFWGALMGHNRRALGLPSSCRPFFDEKRWRARHQGHVPTDRGMQKLRQRAEIERKIPQAERWWRRGRGPKDIALMTEERDGLDLAVLGVWKEAARKAIAAAVADAAPVREIDDEQGDFESDLEVFACYLVSVREALREARAGAGRLLHVQFHSHS